MDEKEYNNLDVYGKLKLMICICYKVSEGLNKVGSEYAAKDYIDRLMDELIDHFNIFSKDMELITEENFGEDFGDVCRNVKNVLELASLIQSGEANYKYAISILNSLGAIAESKLPNNVRLARFLQHLLECKTELSEQLGINEDGFDYMIGKMVDDVDVVNNILTSNNEKKRGSR